MRITSNMYYKSLYGTNNTKLSDKLFDVNKQIASGLKIQYAKDDVAAFSQTMRLDNEISALNQIKSSTQNGAKIVTQTDSVMNEFTTTMDRMRVLLIQASNDASSDISRDAISVELRGLEEHLTSLANTSINGQYLFSGTAVDTKPIIDGKYMGNDGSMNSLLGSGVKQAHNIDGGTLFLGEELGVNRKITTNVPQYNLSLKYPDFSDATNVKEEITLTADDTIRDLMGDNDDDPSNSNGSHFYINGTQSDGTAFNKHITMGSNDKIADLLNQIGIAFGNTTAVDMVNVSLNDYGEIVIEDKVRGSSKIDFHMVGATDYDNTDGNDAGDIGDAIYATAGLIDNLNAGETDFDLIIKGASVAENSDLYVKNFVKSSTSEYKSAQYSMSRAVEAGDTLSITLSNKDDYTTTYTQAFDTDAATTYANLKAQIEADGDFSVVVDAPNDVMTLNTTAQGLNVGAHVNVALANDDGSGVGAVTVGSEVLDTSLIGLDTLVYDRLPFSRDGITVSSQTPQIVKHTNEFASSSTKLFEVADLSQGTVNTLDGTKFIFSGNDATSSASTPSTYYVEIDLASAGSTFSVDTTGDGAVDTTYDIFNTGSPRAAVDADEITYQQLMDVMNMVLTANLPALDNTAGDDSAESLAYDAAIRTSNFEGGTTISYDGKIEFKDLLSSTTKASISLYDANAGNFNSNPSVLTFNSNNALTISDPKTDFFKTIDEVIKSVENYKTYPDATMGDTRNIGIENALEAIDDLQDHVSKSHALVGAQSNSFNRALERTQILEISTMTLRSSIIDTDLAEASLKLAQLTLNYEAMLSTVGRVSKLSLVNYL